MYLHYTILALTLRDRQIKALKPQLSGVHS
jgi:hypothetical protein